MAQGRPRVWPRGRRWSGWDTRATAFRGGGSPSRQRIRLSLSLSFCGGHWWLVCAWLLDSRRAGPPYIGQGTKVGPVIHPDVLGDCVVASGVVTCGGRMHLTPRPRKSVSLCVFRDESLVHGTHMPSSATRGCGADSRGANKGAPPSVRIHSGTIMGHNWADSAQGAQVCLFSFSFYFLFLFFQFKFKFQFGFRVKIQNAQPNKTQHELRYIIWLIN